MPILLDRLNSQNGHWFKQIENYGNNYHVAGAIEKIREKAD